MPHESGLHGGDPEVNSGDLAAKLRADFREPTIDSIFEARPIRLVEIAQALLRCSIHLVQHSHQLVNNVVTEPVIEGGDTLDKFLRQFPSVTRERALAALEAARDMVLAGARTS